MTFLLFLDESGHDHHNMPYEVRGGIALHVSKLWSFVQDVRQMQIDYYGAPLERYKTEIKGSKLLDKDRYKWASQMEELNPDDRRVLCRRFLEKGKRHIAPTSHEFAAYGQASLLMANGVFSSLAHYEAVLFAAAIPNQAPQPIDPAYKSYLRKDFIYLFERFFYFLKERHAYGLLVMDETEKEEQRRLLGRIERYFTSTYKGRASASRVVPWPMFVSSDLAFPVQAADLCIYCLNWGFRLPQRGMDANLREEIAAQFGSAIAELQYRGTIDIDGEERPTYGVFFVPDPYGNY
jgi:hypothetical protein